MNKTQWSRELEIVSNSDVSRCLLGRTLSTAATEADIQQITDNRMQRQNFADSLRIKTLNNDDWISYTLVVSAEVSLQVILMYKPNCHQNTSLSQKPKDQIRMLKPIKTAFAPQILLKTKLLISMHCLCKCQPKQLQTTLYMTFKTIIRKANNLINMTIHVLMTVCLLITFRPPFNRTVNPKYDF